MIDQAQDLIAYCSLNCAKCFGYKMTVSEVAKNLRRELRAAKLKGAWKEIPFLGEYEPFKKSLDGLAALRCPEACRGGGGPPWCKIRKCCQKKGFDGCWECADIKICDELSAEHIRNIKKIKNTQLAASKAEFINTPLGDKKRQNPFKNNLPSPLAKGRGIKGEGFKTK